MKSGVSKLLMSGAPFVFVSAFVGVSLLSAISAGAQGISINPYPNAPKEKQEDPAAAVKQISNADTGVKAGDAGRRLSLDEYRPEGLKPILTNDEDSFVLRLPELSSARPVVPKPVADLEPVIVDVTAKRRVVNVPSVAPPSDIPAVPSPSDFPEPFSKGVPKEMLKASAKPVSALERGSVEVGMAESSMPFVNPAIEAAAVVPRKQGKKRKTTREILDSVLRGDGSTMPQNIAVSASPAFAAVDVLKKLEGKSAPADNSAVAVTVEPPLPQPVVVSSPAVPSVAPAPSPPSAPKIYSNAHEFEIMMGGGASEDVFAGGGIPSVSESVVDAEMAVPAVESAVVNVQISKPSTIAELPVPSSSVSLSSASEVRASELTDTEIESLIKPQKTPHFAEKPIVGLSEKMGSIPVSSYVRSTKSVVVDDGAVVAASVDAVSAAAPLPVSSAVPVYSPAPDFVPMPTTAPVPVMPKDRVSVESVLETIEREVEVASLPAVEPASVVSPAPEIEVGPGLQVIRRSDFQEGKASASGVSAVPSFYSPQGQWKVLQGYELKEILYDWSRQAGVHLVWDTQGQYATRDQLSLDTSYENAVQILLDQYSGQANRPVGQLYTDPDTGARYLVIRTSV